MPRDTGVVHHGYLGAVEGVLASTRTECGRIERATSTNTKGRVRKTWPAVATNVEARISPTGGGEGGATTERDVAGRIAGPQSWTLAFPCGTDVTAADRYVTDSGRTFEISEVLSPGSYQAEVRVLAVEGST